MNFSVCVGMVLLKWCCWWYLSWTDEVVNTLTQKWA